MVWVVVERMRTSGAEEPAISVTYRKQGSRPARRVVTFNAATVREFKGRRVTILVDPERSMLALRSSVPGEPGYVAKPATQIVATTVEHALGREIPIGTYPGYRDENGYLVFPVPAK